MSGKSSSSINPITDPYAERMVLSGLLEHGESIFYDIDSIITESDFYFPETRLIYSSIRHLILESGVKVPDVASIIGVINNTNKEFLNKYEIHNYLLALSTDKIFKENVIPFAKQVFKLSCGRNLHSQLEAAKQKLEKITGEESIRDIISTAEKPVNDFTISMISGGHQDTINLSSEIGKYLEYLRTEKPELLGLPSGFPILDHVIGGGFRKPGIHMIAARAGEGKSFIAVNVARNISDLEVPVLYLDTELTDHIVMGRLAANLLDIDINTIESGDITPDDIKKLSQLLVGRKLEYQNVSGWPHYDWISVIRRWIMKVVGFGNDGMANDCIIILDYVKLMDSKSMGKLQEYQYLGQVMTDLHNICVQYNIPMFALAQLNREGIDNEDQGVVAGSDRIIQLCSSLTLFKKKSAEERATDGPMAGTHKFVPIKSRFGPGLSNGEYISVITNFAKGKVSEGQLSSYLRKSKGKLQLDVKEKEQILL